jgi:PHD/YefM family antitoxin component YafN of YafNO toxin-antitoxin module
MDTVKDRTKELIDLLPSEDVEVLLKVAERLAEWEATSELLEDKEVMASIQRGLEELERGDVVSLKKLRKSV